MHKLLLFLFLMSCSYSVVGQCFSSSGNPVGGSQNMGALDKNVLSVMTFYRYGYFDRYFEGHTESTVSIIKEGNYSYTGVLLGYGLTQKVSLEAELGYFINKTKIYRIPADYRLSGHGLSNAVISAKLRLLQDYDRDISWAVSAGVKVPFVRSLQSVDNVRLPFDLQPSTSAFGTVLQSYLMKQNSFTGMRYFLYNRLDINGQSKDGYHYGIGLVNAIFVSKHIIRTSSWPVSITLIGQVRNEYKNYNTLWDEIEESSGSFKFFFSPQINFAIHDVWNISVMSDIPLYQYYNNIQLAERYSFGVSLTRILPFY